MILFLDLDGVMHPVNQTDPFSRADHLARVLCDFPSVEIVISSAWRKTHTLEKIRSFFPATLQGRIVGVTPEFQTGDADTSAVPGARFHEIQSYLAETGKHNRRWIALDDDPDYFPPRCAELLLCDGKHGFGDAEERILRTVLAAYFWGNP